MLRHMTDGICLTSEVFPHGSSCTLSYAPSVYIYINPIYILYILSSIHPSLHTRRQVQCKYVGPGEDPPSSGLWFGHMAYSRVFYTFEDFHRVPDLRPLLKNLGILAPIEPAAYVSGHSSHAAGSGTLVNLDSRHEEVC